MRTSHKLFPLAVLTLSCAAALTQAQEIIPRPVEPAAEPRVGSEPGYDPRSTAEPPRIILDGHINRSLEAMRRLLGDQRAIDGPRQPLIAAHVEWVRTRNQDGTLSYQGYEVNESAGAGPPTRRPLSHEELEKLYASGYPVVNSGDVPSGSNWRAFTADKGEFTVVHEKGSANRDWEEVSGATALANHPLDPAHTVVFNALPQETEREAGVRERSRMGVAGSTAAWKAVNERIGKASEGYQSHLATKQALLDELQHGTADVIVVYAHFDGERLHLPGGSGANHGSLSDHTISIEELAKIDRAMSPMSLANPRVIVLAACNTASHPANVDSLVQVLLKRGIARTVLATDQPYDARDIPDLMQRLQAKTPLRKAGGQLRQYVELHPPSPLPHLPFNFETNFPNPLQESETHPGE